jgi:hypothetical protein
MITTVHTTRPGIAMFEAMKHGVEAEHLGNGMIQFNTAYIEKISLLVEKLGATILSEEELVPTHPYKL